MPALLRHMRRDYVRKKLLLHDSRKFFVAKVFSYTVTSGNQFMNKLNVPVTTYTASTLSWHNRKCGYYACKFPGNLLESCDNRVIIKSVK